MCEKARDKKKVGDRGKEPGPLNSFAVTATKNYPKELPANPKLFEI